jgi:carboxymethylenebutenolidase
MTRTTIALAFLLVGAGTGYLLATNRSVDTTPPWQQDPALRTTHGEYVAIPNANGDTVHAYVAYPERQGKAPAIIVIHEIFGLTDWEPTVADDFAAKGYVAIVPDLLSSRYGSTAALGDSARRMVGTLRGDDLVADLDAVDAWLRAQPATDSASVGVIGFGWGGGTVWRYASANPRLKAAVVCYGPLADTAMLNTVAAPVLGVYGVNDGRVNNQLPGIVSRMQSLGKSFVADSYPGTGHGFLKPGRNGYGTPAAQQAWADIDAFFTRHLEGQ